MRFQKGIGYTGPRRPRGKGDRSKPGGCYRMSPEAYRARLKNAGRRKLVGGKPPRSYGETRRLELEVALGTQRGETFRAMAKRLNCSHIHCWRVARKYRRGLIPMLPRDEQQLLAMRDCSVSPDSRSWLAVAVRHRLRFDRFIPSPAKGCGRVPPNNQQGTSSAPPDIEAPQAVGIPSG